MTFELESMAIEMPRVSRHPNRLPFRGVLTVVDAPSARPPAGARGHRVRITRAAAERALPSLLGMAVDWTPTLDSHDARRKVGLITEADVQLSVAGCQLPVAAAHAGGHDSVALGFSRGSGFSPNRAVEGVSLKGRSFSCAVQDVIRATASAAEVSPPAVRTDNRQPTTGNLLVVSGFLYAKDFPDLIRELRANARALGMSYEISDARVEDVRAAIWTLTELTFTGAAILRREKAAYEGTSIELAEPRPEIALSIQHSALSQSPVG